jgi:putative glutamine amidotransferase
MKPMIGITPSPSLDTQPHGQFLRYALNEAYASAIEAGGGIPVILPPQSNNTAELIARVDGLLLSGGGDLAPELYGAIDIHPATYGIEPVRDQFELELVAEAISTDLPILAICRGIQVLNVALGGSLVQDIPTQVESTVDHRQQEVGLPADEIGHDIELGDDPAATGLFDGESHGVNSFHHQAIDRLASSLVVVGTAADGVVEAVVRPESRFVVGLQWHPELMFRRHPEQLRPFAALVAKAAAPQLVGVG